MSKVAIVTDSTANIPPEIAQDYPISIAPLQVIWGNETFRDGVDIHPTEFYTRLEQSKTSPTTSQPSPATFISIYRPLLDQGYDILSLHISAKLSGTFDSAVQARQVFPGANIEIVDCNTTAMALGFPVLDAARAAIHGATLQECKTIAEKGCQHTGVLFAVSTLEYLRRGGRIGGAAAFLGTALNLKPILELRDGHIEAIERVRTMGKAIDRLLELFVERIGDQRPIRIAGLHAKAPEEGRQLVERARQRFNAGDVSEVMLAEISPVLGCHTGSGCIGLAYMAGM